MTEVSESLSPESQLLEAMNAHELLAQLFTDAHTAYTFTEEPVTDEEVHAAYDLAKWAPTGVNGQPLRVQLFGAEQPNDICWTLFPGVTGTKLKAHLWYWCAAPKWISIMTFRRFTLVGSAMKSCLRIMTRCARLWPIHRPRSKSLT